MTVSSSPATRYLIHTTFWLQKTIPVQGLAVIDFETPGIPATWENVELPHFLGFFVDVQNASKRCVHQIACDAGEGGLFTNGASAKALLQGAGRIGRSGYSFASPRAPFPANALRNRRRSTARDFSSASAFTSSLRSSTSLVRSLCQSGLPLQRIDARPAFRFHTRRAWRPSRS